MKRFPAIFLRCLLAFVLVVNAVFAPVHVHAPVESDPVTASTDAMPCHDPVDSGVNDGAQPPAASDGCCAAQCLCGCLIASALPDVVAFHAFDAPPVGVAALLEPLRFSPLQSRLLRPPIA